MRNYYVYIHRTNATREKGDIFYIGKGCGYRAWDVVNRNRYWKAIVSKYGLNIEILLNGLTEQQAFNLEKSLILITGREVLCNMTDGGEGASGSKWSEETRAKHRFAHTGKRHSELTKQKVSLARKGTKLSEETKRKMSLAKKGKKFSEEHRAKLSAAQMGNTYSKGSPRGKNAR